MSFNPFNGSMADLGKKREMDKELGMDYNNRFNEYLRYVQDNDPKSIRTRRVAEQDSDMAVRVVEKRDGGIVVRWAKLHQTGAVTARRYQAN